MATSNDGRKKKAFSYSMPRTIPKSSHPPRLTVQAATPNSHKDSGWLIFTDAVMKILNKEKKGLVFILWGKFAQGVGKGIDKKKRKKFLLLF
jgi:hypothetical protein